MFLLGAALSLLLLAVVAVRDARRKGNLRLPPGPHGLPLLGNIRQLPQTFLHRKLFSWTQQYGTFYSFWIMNQPFVVLGGVEVAADVLDRMSFVTSERPPMIKCRRFYFRDMIIVLQDRTAVWRAQRRSMHANLNIRATTRFYPMQANDAAHLALGLLQHPELPLHRHIHRFTASTIVRALYGGDAITRLGEDPSKRIEELTNEGMYATMPQHSVVDALPFLEPLIKRVKWLRRHADKFYTDCTAESTRLYDKAQPSDRWGAETIVHEVKANQEKYELDTAQCVWMTCTIFMAGQETTHTALRTMSLALLHHPEVVRAAQEELDAVCRDRPPTFDDMDKLPYIRAIVKESLRWRSVAPLSLPHVASQDFEYKGYIVPKGTILLDNIWAQARDPAVYRDPNSFNPARWLNLTGDLWVITPDTRLDQLAFGRGRRVCPGRDFAVNGMFIAAAHMLWAFDWAWPVDKAGKPIMCGVDEFIDFGTTVPPKPFDVVLTPRKEKLEERLLNVLKSEVAATS